MTEKKKVVARLVSYVTPAEASKIERAAAADGRPVSSFVAKVLREFLAREAKR